MGISIICDLDGCLIDTSWIWLLLNKNQSMTDDERFSYFNINANNPYSRIDRTCLLVLNYCKKLELISNVIFLTARSESIFYPTANFIQQNAGLVFGKEFVLNCRPVDDKSSAVESKKARLKKIIESGEKILFAIDDDPLICKMYLEHNIPAYRWTIGTIPVDLLKRLGGDICKMERGGYDLICMN